MVALSEAKTQELYQLLLDSFPDTTLTKEQLIVMLNGENIRLIKVENDQTNCLEAAALLCEFTHLFFGMYIATQKNLRNQNLGRMILDKIFDCCKNTNKVFVAEAEPLLAPLSKARILFSERTKIVMNPNDYLTELVEYIETLDLPTVPDIYELSHPEAVIRERRIAYYIRLGMKLNWYDYKMPLNDRAEEKLKMMLVSYPRLLEQDEFEELNEKLKVWYAQWIDSNKEV